MISISADILSEGIGLAGTRKLFVVNLVSIEPVNKWLYCESSMVRQVNNIRPSFLKPITKTCSEVRRLGEEDVFVDSKSRTFVVLASSDGDDV